MNEYAFEMATPAIRFGFGVAAEIGADLAGLGKQHVLVFTDPNLRTLPPVARVLESLESHKIGFSIFDRVRVEPTEESFREAASAARADNFDAFVAIGGGFDNRYGQSGESLQLLSSRFLRFRQSADRKRSTCPRASQTPHCDSHNGRHR